MRSFTTRARVGVIAAALAGGAIVTSCAYPTPYQPATGSGSTRVGYSDERIEENRFRVAFAGNSLTSRETVERYLLYRAAQVTLESGYDYFILVDRDTEKHSRAYAQQRFGPDPWGYWSPHWRYYRARYGWRSWSPFGGDPFFDDVDIRTVDRYEAMAELIVGRGPKPMDNVRAFDARDVIARIGPSVEMPRVR